jgi:hypothetical protein
VPPTKARSWTTRSACGHDGGGYLIATVYTKLGERRVLARVQRAMDAYQQRRPDKRRLHLVADD